jgi:hypothetical protein
MISEKKLQNLGINFSKILPDFQTPTEFYYEFMKIIKGKEEYFKNLGLENLIKIILYAWSHKKTNNFKLALNAISNLKYLTLFYHNDESYEPRCDTCDGDGYVECDECNGRGVLECEECADEGYVDCTYCENDNPVSMDDEGEEIYPDCEECDNTRRIECPNCGGQEITCKECRGRSRSTCPDCNGNGYLETDKIYYTITCVISWDENLNLKAEYCLQNKTKLMELDEMSNDYYKNIIFASEEKEDDSIFEPNDITSPDETFFVLDIEDEFDVYLNFNTSANRINWVVDEYPETIEEYNSA